jgi:hypothetical protein
VDWGRGKVNLGEGRLDWMRREGRLSEGGTVDSGEERLDWVRREGGLGE